jgi:hypothetical protein
MRGSKRLKYSKQIDPHRVKWIRPSNRDALFALFVISPIWIWILVKLWLLPIIIN